ncbi:acyl-CoA thioesterase [Thalassospira tepidiphila]|jgi:acyl-CoA thioester hydrolase|uniref:acyl-CoA thioesterase n=1 Tax=Thalassospira TaxID=168934 RepID=UPI000EBD37E9|nr:MULTISPECIES: thioesterase family protein [Thalassospira]MBS8272799.1 acyl-CoA thioesterase [Thalassospira tepidiphila]HAI30427.1 acyl-CoA thioesterase [Thalassospira sp.]|tara:strand:+ start:10053 stop:10460 length:408 start_codon:yes stop_codon:yes gene_type:complete
MLSSSVTEKVQFYHLDPMNVVWHGNYVQFFENARCALLDKVDYNYPQMDQSGFVWPVVDMRVKYVAPCHFGQEITITASLREYENRLKIDYLVTDAKTGQKLTKGFTIQVAVEKHSGEMLYRSPDFFIEKMEALL